MKYWLSHLPLEVWVDVYRYPWISREELGRIVDRFCNRKYAEYLQFYLHDWGRRKLNHLFFEKDVIRRYFNYPPFRLNMDFPETPMPANIKSFECISIRHFDQQKIDFLRRIGPILTNVNLDIYYFSPNSMNNLRLILAYMMPLLDGIHSLSFNIRSLPTMQQCFGKEEFDKIKVLAFYAEEDGMEATANFLLNWLTTRPRQGSNIGPRFCKTHLSKGLFEKISPAIREQFTAAKTPCTFALIVRPIGRWKFQQFAELHLTNGIGEELHGLKIGRGCVQITRHPANCGTELQAWIESNAEKENYRQIRICYPTIGPIDAMEAPENVDEDQQPSTSKKARIC